MTGFMKNTDFNSSILGSIISSEDSLNELLDMIAELGLEITGVCSSL